jgi:hypothetical protein
MEQQPHLTPEMLVPRLGDYLVQRAYITETDLQKALAYQQEKMTTTRPICWGRRW